MLVICISPCAHYILHCYKVFESMQYCTLTEAAVRLPQWSISDTFNTGIKEHNFQKIDRIFYEYSRLNIMSILLQNIKKKQNSQSDKLLSEKQLNFCIMRSCNIFFNTISFKPHSWYLNGFNKEHTSMLLVSTLFRRKTMCIFT